MAEDMIEDVVRQAITAAFLEGGECVWTASTMGIELTEDRVNAATDAYVAAALPNLMSALRDTQGEQS